MLNEPMQTRPSAKLVGMYLALFVVALITGRFATFSMEWSIYAWAVVLAVGLFYFMVLHLRRITTVYTLDNTNLTCQIGILSKKIIRIPLNRITNYEVRQSFFERILGLGDLDIDTAGGSGAELKMTEMEILDIQEFVNALSTLIAEQRMPAADANSEQVVAEVDDGH